MGLASSQARLLLLTARKSDLEYRGQQINNRRLQLTYRLEEISTAYSDGIANRRLYWNSSSDEELTRLTYETITSNNMYVVDADGNQIPVNEEGTIDPDVLEAGLRNGTYKLTSSLETNGSDDYIVDWRTSESVQDNLYDDDDEAVTAEYEAESAKVQSQDKRLELELKQVDTQHKAVQTEIDAVKKVIDKNVESSFKTFG